MVIPNEVTTISVGRDGHELGDFHLDGLQEGLASGYFRADDWAWYEGLAEWRPLSEIVDKLSAPPPPPPPAQTVLPPPFVAPPAFEPLAIAPAPRIKQNLAPRNGKVNYVLKEHKEKKRAKKAPIAPNWRNDPATEKQIAFLSHLKAGPQPSNLTKGQAHDMIDARLSDHDFLSPKQMACLSYHGFDPSSLDYDTAKDLLDRIHDNPESFKVPEPWATAKYHLYPSLYPDDAPKSRRWILWLLLLLAGIAVLIFMSGKN